jgi:hypothetical protein
MPLPVVFISVFEIRTRRVDQRWIDGRERHCCTCYAELNCPKDLLCLLVHNCKIDIEDVYRKRSGLML